MVKWITFSLALAGLLIGVFIAATAGRDQPQRPPSQPPSTNPFDAAIAATGLVEAASRNIELAAPQAGLVMTVHATVNDQVEAGDPLFELDARLLEAELITARADLARARARYDRLAAEPRPVTVPVLQAAVAQAEADLRLAQELFKETRELFESGSASPEEYDRRKFEMEAAEARLGRARADLNELKAGTWEKELAVAQADVGQARARIDSLKRRIDRLTVYAPQDGTILKREVEPGEFASPVNDEPAFVLGDLSTLHVRAQVNEEDAPRLREGAAAVARIRGPLRERVDLKMLRIEPLAEPKRQLTGVTTELIDTRVIEVVFEIAEPADVPVYPGQIVDVFIEAPNEQR